MRARRSRETKVQPESVLTPAKQYEDHALAELRAAGFRITMPRVQVIRALADTETALSAYAIHEKIVETGGKIDVVSVYRILATLEEVGLIHHIGIVDGYFPARMEESNPRQSEVVVDENTLAVKELPIAPEILRAIEAQAATYGFTPEQIKVEIRANFG